MKDNLLTLDELREQLSNETNKDISEEELVETLIDIGVLIRHSRTNIMSKQGFDNDYLALDTTPGIDGRYRGYYTKKLKNKLLKIFKESEE